MQNIENHVLPPLLHPRTTPPPPFFFFFFFFFFCFFKNLFWLKINILSSVYPDINFPAEHVMTINNLSRPKCQPPPSESNGRPLRVFSSRVCGIIKRIPGPEYLFKKFESIFITGLRHYWKGYLDQDIYFQKQANFTTETKKRKGWGQSDRGVFNNYLTDFSLHKKGGDFGVLSICSVEKLKLVYYLINFI